MGKAIAAMFYTAAVEGTHKALADMGMIPADAQGSKAEQVRALADVGPPPELPAIAGPTPPAPRPARPAREKGGS